MHISTWYADQPCGLHMSCVGRQLADDGIDTCCGSNQNCMWMLQGMLSDGRPLLAAVAPAASTSVTAAAVSTMGNRLTAALDSSGALDTQLDDAHLLPWRAFQSMAYMVRV